MFRTKLPTAAAEETVLICNKLLLQLRKRIERTAEQQCYKMLALGPYRALGVGSAKRSQKEIAKSHETETTLLNHCGEINIS